MSVTTQAMQLADQINDEFLTCKICYEHYKEPKSLSCLHTFCEECIEQHVGAQRSYKYTDYREFSCPICRKKTVIPSGGCRKLADNFLISNLNELMLSKKPSKIPYCDICKIINARERDATSQCVECQKHMCAPCVQFHSRTKITSHHSIFELDIEKDIMCKDHPNEQVRFYCETCEDCVCVPCTYTKHRDCDLVDFKDGIKHHKDKIEQNLSSCRNKIQELKERSESLRSCESRILNTQNEIHTVALGFVESIRSKEKSLIEELDEVYGYETMQYLKKKEDLNTFLDQLSSTCNLTEMVVKGKDIEMLLLKKQLCEKFNDFDLIQIDPVPKNLSKKIVFRPGLADLGKIMDPETEDLSTSLHQNSNSTSGIMSSSAKASPSDSGDEKSYFEAKESTCDEDEEADENDDDDEQNDDGYDYGGERKKKKKLTKKNSDFTEKCTQITDSDIEDLQGENTATTATSQSSTHALTTKESKEIQTDAELYTQPLSENNRSLSNQSSMDEDSNGQSAPVDRNKLGRRVRRHVKPGCSIAVLPSSEIIIIDPEGNCISILDRRGKFKYGMSNSNKSCNSDGHAANSAQFGQAAFGHLPRLDRGVRLLTPQGTLIVKLINESSAVAAPPPVSVVGSVESTPARTTPSSSRPGSVVHHHEGESSVVVAPIADNEENVDEIDEEDEE